jgi:hypothetical protein
VEESVGVLIIKKIVGEGDGWKKHSTRILYEVRSNKNVSCSFFALLARQWRNNGRLS